MFEVIRKDSGIQLTVYSVIGPPSQYFGSPPLFFLFYINNSWEWHNAYDYEPISKEDK